MMGRYWQRVQNYFLGWTAIVQPDGVRFRDDEDIHQTRMEAEAKPKAEC